MSRSIRFRPPALAPAPEVRWMLLRAFGPAGAPWPGGPLEVAEVVALARRFELAARIAARQGLARVAEELGEEGAGELRRDRARAAAQGERLLAGARAAAAAAADLGVPVAFLKYVALELGGYLPSGSRPACDVDLLVPARAARDLQAALAARGFAVEGTREEEHQLPILAHPAAGAVEVHDRIPGVRLRRASATFEDLEAAGLLAPARGLPGCRVPRREVLAAHALVHGLAQHGWAPGAYSLLRTMGDLIDLGFGGSDGEALAARIASWVARDLAAAELAAARELCALLARGELPGEGGADVLLRHALAGRLDERYARALKLGLFRGGPSDLAPPLRLARDLWRSLALTRGQIAALYGRPATPLGYLGRRLWRPLDLLRRLAAYGAAALGRDAIKKVKAGR